ncbi:tryptophan dimethylallyltransferase-domain-containing protein [Gautieria morchelliformis]|nr:tryptophan dimethylallyltransferase-domain-containing protein [Gautieria morchelliformis]
MIHSAETSHSRSTSDSEIAVFWRGILLNRLSKMLSAGNYSPAQHSRHLDFSSEWVVPFLGPKPRSINGKDVPVFNSYMCDDNTPIEFSVSWKPGNRNPMVRFSIEPLPPDEHTAPSNIVAYGLQAMDSLHRALQAPASTLSNYLLLEPSRFTEISKNIGCSNVQGATIVSNIFLGFDLLPSHAQAKAYCVLHSALGLLETLTLVNSASPYTADTATSALFTYFQTKPAEW